MRNLYGPLMLVALAACKPASNEPVDGMQFFKDELFKTRPSSGMRKPYFDATGTASNCFLKYPAYCLKDDHIIDPLLQRVVDDELHGKVPPTKAKLKRSMRHVTKMYKAHQRTAEGMKQLQDKLGSRYAKPDTSELPAGELYADLGFVPFVIGVDGSGNFEVASSPLLENEQWSSKEIARRLKDLAEKHPEAKLIHMLARVPIKSSGRIRTLTGRRVHVGYRPSSRKIALTERWKARETYYVATLPERGLDAVIAGEVSLLKKDLEACYPSKRGSEGGTSCLP